MKVIIKKKKTELQKEDYLNQFQVQTLMEIPRIQQNLKEIREKTKPKQ